MKILLDATSLINLVHGNILEQILGLPGAEFGVGSIVLSECKSIKERLQSAIDTGTLKLLADDLIDATKYLSLLSTHGLGPGETECLAAASLNADIVCSDDGRARRVISGALGPGRVTGCLGLLARACQLKVISVAEAVSSYEQMRSKGGFLPEISKYELTELIAKLK